MVVDNKRNTFNFSNFIISLLIKKKKKKIDIIHFNEITLIPTIFIFKFFSQYLLFYIAEFYLRKTIILEKKYAIS